MYGPRKEGEEDSGGSENKLFRNLAALRGCRCGRWGLGFSESIAKGSCTEDIHCRCRNCALLMLDEPKYLAAPMRTASMFRSIESTIRCMSMRYAGVHRASVSRVEPTQALIRICRSPLVL